MLDLESNPEKQVNFAVDILGLATRYDFTVVRWGITSGEACTVSHNEMASHEQWLAVDIRLKHEGEAERFKTDALMSGLFLKQRGEYFHLSPDPFETVE